MTGRASDVPTSWVFDLLLPLVCTVLEEAMNTHHLKIVWHHHRHQTCSFHTFPRNKDKTSHCLNNLWRFLVFVLQRVNDLHHARGSKRVLDSGFYTMKSRSQVLDSIFLSYNSSPCSSHIWFLYIHKLDSGFFISGIWVPIVSGTPDSLS